MLLEEKVDSLHRRFAALMEDLEEFYSKVNKARQRVVKEERDAIRKGEGPAGPVTRDELKAQLRARMRTGSV